jgi:hypothetical protein
MATSTVVSGLSTTNWVQDTAKVLHIDVDTSAAKFKKTPVYVASLYGRSGHWGVIGVGSIFTPTATGFSVYINRSDFSPLALDSAVSGEWRVAWIGIED